MKGAHIDFSLTPPSLCVKRAKSCFVDTALQFHALPIADPPASTTCTHMSVNSCTSDFDTRHLPAHCSLHAPNRYDVMQTSLFPVPGDGCGNCSVEFHVRKNISTGTEYYTVVTTEEKAASCNGTCPEVSSDTTTHLSRCSHYRPATLPVVSPLTLTPNYYTLHPLHPLSQCGCMLCDCVRARTCLAHPTHPTTCVLFQQSPMLKILQLLQTLLTQSHVLCLVPGAERMGR